MVKRYRKYRYKRKYSFRKRKFFLKSKSFWLFILFGLLFSSFVYFILFSDFFNLKNVIISGNFSIPKEIIEETIKKETKNVLFVNSKNLREQILKTFPELEEVQIKKKLPNVLNLALAERREVAVFCREEVCFLLDDNGIIFDKSNKKSSLPVVYNQTLSKEIELGDSVINKKVLEIILELSSKLKSDLGITAEEFSLITKERIDIKTKEGWSIYLSLKKDLEGQIFSLSTLLKEKIPETKRKKLKYIDLRFNKIFIYPSL